tara:strand:- start:1170 stop:1412 length:243 start_codon:yes stop_codon:yes gene_type:complete
MLNIKNITYRDWPKFYKRGFLTGVFVCVLFVLMRPSYIQPFDTIEQSLFNLSLIFMGSVFCGFIALVVLFVIVMLKKIAQ